MTVAYESDVGSFERRIGRRIEVRPTIPLRLGEPPTSSGSVPVWAATMVDVSVTGAGLEGDDSLPLRPGESVCLDIEGRLSMVRVARTEATDRPGVRRVGVEFTHLNPEVRDLVDQLVGEGRPGEHAWRGSS